MFDIRIQLVVSLKPLRCIVLSMDCQAYCSA